MCTPGKILQCCNPRKELPNQNDVIVLVLVVDCLLSFGFQNFFDHYEAFYIYTVHTPTLIKVHPNFEHSHVGKIL